MFKALGFSLENDHIDFSFRDTASWPRVGPDEFLPPSLFISLGDPECGPDIQLVTFPPPLELMWIDSHYHACDQFRAIAQGDFQVDWECLTPSAFGYQDAGVPYREGFPGISHNELWMLMVHGERRGARSTMLRANGDFAISAFGEDQLDRPVASPSDSYWNSVPGGARGRIGTSTTLGQPVNGFVWGSFDNDKGWREVASGVSATAALMSDAIAGPMVLTLRSTAGSAAMPRARYDTEVVLAILSGSAWVGKKEYRAGEIRVQQAGVFHDAIVAGLDGFRAIFMIADRRARPHVKVAHNDWSQTIDALIEELSQTSNKSSIDLAPMP